MTEMKRWLLGLLIFKRKATLTKIRIEKCGCTDLEFMAAEAERNFERYTADMNAVPKFSRNYWKSLDYQKFWPPHLQQRCHGVTKRVGVNGEVMNSIVARWMIDHPPT